MESISIGFWKFYQERVLPTLRMEARYVACGYIPEQRITIKYRGNKATAYRAHDMKNVAQVLLHSYVAPGIHSWKTLLDRPSLADDEARMTLDLIHQDPDFIRIYKDAISKISDLVKAQEMIAKNRERAREASRGYAIKRLAKWMREFEHDFSQEEVVEAWNLSRIERVMEG